ncbi:YggT family protein [Alkalibacillus filiformis]|uniref:Membrane protein n=2 Tax=Alkalibacillus TaxID=331654 RepID=A0A511W1B1_9BACI|nr:MULTISPECIES: YggT family protein [Alkalibacillus]MDQ0350536.1 YggT family protein [Alkalibacillus filiformis]MDV2582561.1 YggT family protein [Alkalibacillus haloalkaliphilus]GEN44834.1 membrane protein [Alkalibacillus haloalkaliphilus]
MDALLSLILLGVQIYSFMLIGYIFMSWFPGARESQFGQFLAKACEPYLEPFRKFVPPLGMIDISPIVAIITLHLASQGLIVLFGMLF